MQDLKKQLQCEKESVNEWQMRRDKRMLVLASMQTSTPREKALFRQVKAEGHSFVYNEVRESIERTDGSPNLSKRWRK